MRALWLRDSDLIGCWSTGGLVGVGAGHIQDCGLRRARQAVLGFGAERMGWGGRDEVDSRREQDGIRARNESGGDGGSPAARWWSVGPGVGQILPRAARNCLTEATAP